MMVRIIAKEKNNKQLFLSCLFSLTQISLKLKNTNNYAKETEENRKPYIWNKKT